MRDLRVIKKRDCYVVMDYSNARHQIGKKFINKARALNYRDQLYVKEIRVDGGSMLKRLRPAPQGRAHRIRKRSNHVTIVVGSNNNTQSED
mgnify:CR=1 FL=1